MSGIDKGWWADDEGCFRHAASFVIGVQVLMCGYRQHCCLATLDRSSHSSSSSSARQWRDECKQWAISIRPCMCASNSPKLAVHAQRGAQQRPPSNRAATAHQNACTPRLHTTPTAVHRFSRQEGKIVQGWIVQDRFTDNAADEGTGYDLLFPASLLYDLFGQLEACQAAATMTTKQLQAL